LMLDWTNTGRGSPLRRLASRRARGTRAPRRRRAAAPTCRVASRYRPWRPLPLFQATRPARCKHTCCQRTADSKNAQGRGMCAQIWAGPLGGVGLARYTSIVAGFRTSAASTSIPCSVSIALRPEAKPAAASRAASLGSPAAMPFCSSSDISFQMAKFLRGSDTRPAVSAAYH
jgi:hypothetical protein